MRILYVVVALVAISVAAIYVSCESEPRTDSRSGPLMSVNPPSATAIDVLTQHNNVGRTGANAKETLLTATGANAINNTNFGELWKLPVDGQVAAQPLYVSNYAVSGQSARNILIVATLNNTVYAFDADSSSPQPLWTPYHDAQPFGGIITNNKPTGHNPRVDGIMSTPVIDRNKPVAGKSPGVIYFMELVASGDSSDF